MCGQLDQNGMNASGSCSMSLLAPGAWQGRQVSSDQTIASTGSCTPAVSSSANVQRLSYTASNRIDGYGFTYDDAGNVTGDGTVDYAYDAEGRVCASHKGVVGWTGYLYDAEGNRVAKGTLNPPANSNPCDFSTNGFVLTNEYILGPDGSAMTELDGQGNRVRTDVGADPGLLVSYDNRTLHLNVMDWLGTKRLQLSSGGVAETQYSGAPFGDQLLEKQLSANVGTTSPKYLTGKERDAESGLDYFGARYYASSMGHWMSPDWSAKQEPVPYSSLDNPQSLNLYGYVLNNPLSKADPDGHAGCPPDCSTGNNVADFFLGAANAFSSDNLLGAGRVNQTSTGGQLGQMLGDAAATVQGAAQVVLGTGGNIAGVALDATGVGAAIGVPVNVVSTAVTVEGAGAATMGAVNLMKRAGDFSGSTREGAIKNNAEQNGGTNKCEKCGQELQRVGNKSGQKPPDNQLHVMIRL